MPAERNPEVFAMVEAELRSDRTVGTQHLYERATNMDKQIADLSIQEFNARYPLPVRRRFAREEGRYRPPTRRKKDIEPTVEISAQPTTNGIKVSPFLADREQNDSSPAESVAGNGHANGHAESNGHHESLTATTPTLNRIGRTGVRRQAAAARARMEGPKLEFNEQALRTTLLRLMRDVAEACDKGHAKVVEIAAKVDSYASDVRETVRIVNVQ